MSSSARGTGVSRAGLAPAALMLALTVGLVWVCVSAMVPVALGVGVAGLVVVVAALGLRRTGVLVLGASYFLAVGSRSESLAVLGPNLSASDALFALALLLLLPSLAASGLPRVALMPVFGLAMMFPTFLVATALYSESVPASILTISAFAVSAILIPATLIALRPDARLLQGLAWCFVAGHVADTLYSVVRDPTTGIRHQGITQHPNAFAGSGLMAFALLMYLVRTTRRPWLAAVAMIVSLASIYLSGSRGATIGVAAIVLAVPIIERTPLAGTLLAIAAAAGLVGLKYVVPLAGPDSAVARLVGGGTSGAADNDREAGLTYGFDRFGQHPLIGSGLADVGQIHVNLLEIAVGGGVVALIGFLLVVLAMARPMLSVSPDRRLVYTVVAFVAFSTTYPALGDRSLWLVVSLSLAVFHGFREKEVPPPEHARPAGDAARLRAHEPSPA